MKGRPVLGVVSGLLLGLLLAIATIRCPTSRHGSLIGLPAIGVVLGLVVASTALFGKKF